MYNFNFLSKYFSKNTREHYKFNERFNRRNGIVCASVQPSNKGVVALEGLSYCNEESLEPPIPRLSLIGKTTHFLCTQGLKK